MKISVLGAGSWGTTVASIAASRYDTVLWARDQSVADGIEADRENSRIQFFTGDGEYLSEWTDVVRPCEVFIDSHDNVFVAELGRRAGMFPWRLQT